MLNRQSIGTLEMSVAMILSGFIGFLVIESEQSVWNVIFFRCVFGALGLLIYCHWRGLLSPWPLKGKNFRMAVLAALALILNWVLLFSAYHYASISLATVVYNTQPFFLLIAGSLLLGERIVLAKLPWFVSAFVGLLLIVDLTFADLQGSEQILGFVLALGAAILYALNTLLTKRLTGIRVEVIALLNTLVGCVVFLPLIDFSALPASPWHWSYLIVLGLVHTCLMYILLYSAYQKLPVTMIAILAFLYPAVAIMVDFFIYQQSLTLYQWLGVSMVLLSVAGLNLGWKISVRA